MANPTSNHPWSWSEADYATPEEYCRACLIDLNPAGAVKAKALCKLPVRDPASAGGHLNRNGVHAAASRLHQVDAPQAAISHAREMLSRLGYQVHANRERTTPA